MNPRLRSRAHRALRFALAMGVALVAALSTGGAGAANADPPQAATVKLDGGGSWGMYRELLDWQNDLAGSKSPIDLGYAAHGTFLGRNDFVDGNLDFVISGAPFTADQLAKVNGGAAGLASIPIQVSALAFVLQQPVPEGLATLQVKCDPDDPNIPDPTKCVVKKPYTGPVKVPSANLAAMALKHPGTVSPPLSSWNNPGVLGAMGVENFTTPLLAGPAPVLRSDQDEVNLFLQQFAALAAPSVWSGLKQSDARIQWEPITERMPRQAGASRDGVTQQGTQLALGGGDPSSGTISNFTAGVFAPVPPSAVGGIKQAFPKAKIEFIQVQNANGDWVSPTPDSIDAAVNAGGMTPLHALTNKVPGAYPLVWVDNMYVPAHGLTIGKTEALAATARYIVTAGQDAAAPVGEGRLSLPLVATALAATDAFVRSNCTGNDRHVVESTDAGPLVPEVPTVKTIGTMAHCEPGAPTDNGGGSGGSGGSSGSFDSSSLTSTGSSSGSAGAATDAGAGSAGGGIGSKHGAVAVLSASKLPLGLPPAAGGVDRIATVLLGVGAYFLLRKPVRKLLRREPA